MSVIKRALWWLLLAATSVASAEELGSCRRDETSLIEQRDHVEGESEEIASIGGLTVEDRWAEIRRNYLIYAHRGDSVGEIMVRIDGYLEDYRKLYPDGFASQQGVREAAEAMVADEIAKYRKKSTAALIERLDLCTRCPCGGWPAGA